MEVGFVEFQLALVKNKYIYKQYKKIDLGMVVTCNSKYRLDEEKAQNLRTRSPEFVVFKSFGTSNIKWKCFNL